MPVDGAASTTPTTVHANTTAMITRSDATNDRAVAATYVMGEQRWRRAA